MVIRNFSMAFKVFRRKCRKQLHNILSFHWTPACRPCAGKPATLMFHFAKMLLYHITITSFYALIFSILTAVYCCLGTVFLVVTCFLSYQTITLAFPSPITDALSNCCTFYHWCSQLYRHHLLRELVKVHKTVRLPHQASFLYFNWYRLRLLVENSFTTCCYNYVSIWSLLLSSLNIMHSVLIKSGT